MVHSHDFYNLYQDTYLKYRNIYGEKVAVFLQKGAFYEFYGLQDPETSTHRNTVKEFTDILGCVVNYYPDDAPGGLTGLFAGVPDYTLDKWAGKLTGLGWTVAVITQEDDIKPAAGGRMKRSVSRILSPGTHVENIDNTASCYVGAYNPSADISIAIDIISGAIIYNAHTNHAAHFFQIYPPRELIIYNAHPTYTEETARKTLYISPQAVFYNKTALPATYSRPIHRMTYLENCFKARTLVPFQTWLGMSEELCELLTCLILWIEDHHSNLIVRLPQPTQWHPENKIHIINNALAQLNIIGSSPTTIEKLFVTPSTAPGRRALPGVLCSPYAEPIQIVTKQHDVTWIADSTAKHTQILKQLHDFPRIHRAIARGSVHAGALLQLYQSLKTMQTLHGTLVNGPFQDNTIDDALVICLRSFEYLFDMDKALKSQETPADWSFLRDSVGPASAQVELAIQRIHVETCEWIGGLCISTGIPVGSLTFKPTDKTDYMVHGTKTVLQTVQSALKRQANTTPYSACSFKILSSGGRIEHDYLDKQQRRLDAQRAALRRAGSDEVLKACITYSDETYTYWSALEDWVIRIDHAVTYAATNKKYNWKMPMICGGSATASSVSVRGLRHPLIEIQHSAIELVTHDLALDTNADHGLLLYGVNASGKSSLMKALGISVILAQLGCGVPALEMTLTPYKKIASRILNQDNLWAGLSSFAVEMTELRDILTLADAGTLVLGDELCSGTESISATAIVAAGISHLIERRSSFILATHLHDLNKLPAVIDAPGLRIAHLKVHYDVAHDVLIYDRTLSQGPGASNYGLTVAKALHMPADVIDKAYGYRRLLTGDTHQETHKTNTYNANVLCKTCTVCGSNITRDLEIHHIQEQQHALSNVNTDGTNLHGLRNLIVVCRTCHDAHHSGNLHIGPLKQTSAGPQRNVETISKSEPTTIKNNTIGDLSADVVEGVAAVAKAHPSLSTKLLIFQIKERLGVDVTSTQIATMRRKKLI